MDKQVVPEVVADYISEGKDSRYTLYGAFTFMAQCNKEVPSPDYYTDVSETALFKRKAVKVHKWVVDGHQNKFALAWIYGYKVREQLYYVRFTGNNGDFLNLNTETGKVFTGGHQEIYEYKAQFTMPEIIAIDPRYKAFAVKVEEVDNEND